MRHEESARRLLSEEGSAAFLAEFKRNLFLAKSGLGQAPTEELKKYLWDVTLLVADGVYVNLDYDELETRRAHVYKALLLNWAEEHDWPQFYTYKKIAQKALFEYRRIERYVRQYGEGYRSIFTDALKFLDERERSWKLDEPIDRDEYIFNIASKAKVKSKEKLTMAELGYSRVGLNNV